MITVAIVEDTEKDIDVLKEYFDAFSSETGVKFSITCFRDGLNFFNAPSANFSVVIFDIAMPHINGMQAAIKLRENNSVSHIIFATSMSQYALQGYDVGAVDFLVKPVKYERFKRTISRVVSDIRKSTEKEVVIKSSSRTIVLNTSQIFYIEVMEHYLKYHTDMGEIINYGKLVSLEEELKDYGFARCNNCYLINMKYISEIKDEEICVGGDWLKIAHKRKKTFMQTVAAYYAGR